MFVKPMLLQKADLTLQKELIDSRSHLAEKEVSPQMFMYIIKKNIHMLI